MPVFSDFEQLLQQKLGNMVLTDKILLNFSGLGAKLDFLDLSLDDFKDIFQSQNISELRRKMIGILKEVFRLVQEYSIYFKKAFYIVSLVLIVYDAYRYWFTLVFWCYVPKEFAIRKYQNCQFRPKLG